MSKYNWKLFFFAQLILFVALQPKSWTSVSIRFITKLSQASSLTEEVRYELTCGRIELAADSCRANSAESMWQAFVYLYWDWKGVGTQNCLQIRTHIIYIHISSSHRYSISYIHTYCVCSAATCWIILMESQSQSRSSPVPPRSVLALNHEAAGSRIRFMFCQNRLRKHDANIKIPWDHVISSCHNSPVSRAIDLNSNPQISTSLWVFAVEVFRNM